MGLPSVMCNVSCTKTHVLLQVIDAPEGKMYQMVMDWREFEAFVREHGKAHDTKEFPRKMSEGLRDMMESDPDSPP